MKQNEPSPTSLLHVPHCSDAQMHWSQHANRQILCALLLVHPLTDAVALVLVSTGAAQAAAPASPMLRST
jgi:hypothetical protein